MYQIGSAVIHPVKQRVWKILRIEGPQAWLCPLTGRPSEEGPFKLADLRSGVSSPMRFTF